MWAAFERGLRRQAYKEPRRRRTGYENELRSSEGLIRHLHVQRAVYGLASTLHRSWTVSFWINGDSNIGVKVCIASVGVINVEVANRDLRNALADSLRTFRGSLEIDFRLGESDQQCNRRQYQLEWRR
jgi:hypothetical protein